MNLEQKKALIKEVDEKIVNLIKELETKYSDQKMYLSTFVKWLQLPKSKKYKLKTYNINLTTIW